ncbi:hemolysin family protein [Rhodoferax sp.]|uniref:hemolysin family protein n=1 Tax=Rhodoferax sp. TaxID=50421 RepID=UPI0026074B2B|nr:hemolysin family protein [Rhodoferax sp.]MDD4943157.1 hemolysin family protein [Rhodoferax sp.]MDD5478582.1 hemolysin family protein [Rhodoferax sp.]
MEFLLIVFLTLLNGVFAMSELALAASRKSRLNAMADEGDKGAQAALLLLDNPNQFLSTVQVGITSIGVLNGIVGEAAFSAGLAAWLVAFGVADKAAAISATALVVTMITFTTIIFGELVPKRIGQLYPEVVSRVVARPMLWLAKAAGPFVKLLSGATAAVLQLMRIDTQASRAMTEEEISASLEEGVDAGVIEEHEHQMVQNVFGLDDRPLTSLMVPRAEVDWLDASATVAQGLQKVALDGASQAHSWYPVCRGSLDEVVGKISLAHMLELGVNATAQLEAVVSPVVFVPETLSGMELLEQFRAKVGRLVLVVDEYGVVQGMLTPHDLLEAITGELQPSVTSEAWAVQREDGSWLLDGMMPVSELKARLDLDDLPLEERGRYNTVAGLLMAVSGHLPATGEKINCEGWCFEVLDLDGRRVDKVLASQLEAESDTL